MTTAASTPNERNDMTAAGTAENWMDKPCNHFWDIPPAQGQYSKGTCRLCGAVREFSNFIESLQLAASRGRGIVLSIQKRRKRTPA